MVKRLLTLSVVRRLSNHIRGVLKVFGLLPGAIRGLPFDSRVEALLAEREDLELFHPTRTHSLS